jgi:hypothetical protein
MNRIDELFKNKLANHQVAPSADAWQKVEAGLTKKNNAWVWRLAAAFVLFGLLSGAWYWWNTNSEAQPELVQQPNTPQKENTVPVQPEEQNLVAEAEIKSELQQSKKKTTKTNASETKKETQPEKVEKVKVEEPQVLSQTEVLVAENKTEPAPARKPIVIEFTLEPMPVNVAEPAVALANADDDKSGLQKILEKARDIKNGDSELGSLRDAKNELFAFEFRKDKTKRN